MRISIPSSVVFHSSSAVDDVFTMADTVDSNGVAIEISKGLQIKDGTDIFEYTGNSFTPVTFNSVVETYTVGQVVLYLGELYKITGKEGTGVTTVKRPKEPEEYASWETNIATFASWTKRYFRVADDTHVDGSGLDWLSANWTVNSRWYYMFWESRGFGGCGDGAWRWSAKDLNQTGIRDITWYLRTCLKDTTTNKFNFATDKKATIYTWGSTGQVKLPTLQFNNLIRRNNYFYFRTHLDLPVEYVTNTIGSTIKYSLTKCTTPQDISDDFIVRQKVCGLLPFDGKNYTECKQSPSTGKVDFIFTNTGQFDAVALGRVLADYVSVVVTDQNGVIQSNVSYYPIDNLLGAGGMEYPITTVLYTPTLIEEECTIKVTLFGDNVSLGNIFVGATIDAGMTNTVFENKFKDFSPKEQDQWGNIYYVDGVRVHSHSGTVDMPTDQYDRINRLLNFIGGNEVIINGSDSLDNTPTNSLSIFQATMMVGRFTNLTLKTQNNGDSMSNLATYSFAIEEVV